MPTSVPLVEVFGSALCAAQRAWHDGTELASTLTEVIRSAEAAWPGVLLAPERFMIHLAEVLSRPENAGHRLGDLHTDDLYLACACAAADQRAISSCDAHARQEIDRTLQRMDLPTANIDEVKQILRERLFVSAGAERPYIAAYSGRGRLAGWMRVIAVRYALQQLRGQKRVRLVEESEIDQLAEHARSPARSPEQEHMKLLYQTEFQEAFRQAVETLPPREQEILRAHFIHGQTIDQLGEAHGVHRATAARWLDRAKRALIAAIRRVMMQELQVDKATYQSVLRLVLSQLDFSVRIILGEEPGPR